MGNVWVKWSVWLGLPLLMVACNGGARQTECRGVRGATTADANTSEAILAATDELIRELVRANGIEEKQVASVIVTSTPDLNGAFPAKAVRLHGWKTAALLGATEVGVAGALKRCVRVLVLWNTTVPQDAIQHVYLKGAAALRPDRAKGRAFVKGTAKK